MALYQLKLAYDGTDFLGFQRQRKGRTVQSEFETALRQLGWTGRSILAAGRTDRGVHASGQVVAFNLNWVHADDKLQNALNAALPEDLAIVGIEQVEKGFHPRFEARARNYVYRIYCSPSRQPLKDRFTWRVWPTVKLTLLEKASEKLIGEYDFSAFGRPPYGEAGTIRKIFSADWKRNSCGLQFEVSANAFLYHMVRRMVFLQVKVGQGILSVEDFDQAVQDQKKLLPGIAPARGLELAQVKYD